MMFTSIYVDDMASSVAKIGGLVMIMRGSNVDVRLKEFYSDKNHEVQGEAIKEIPALVEDESLNGKPRWVFITNREIVHDILRDINLNNSIPMYNDLSDPGHLLLDFPSVID